MAGEISAYHRSAPQVDNFRNNECSIHKLVSRYFQDGGNPTRPPPGRCEDSPAQRAGKMNEVKNWSPVGTTETWSAVPMGLHSFANGNPGTGVPGYYHSVPPGRITCRPGIFVTKAPIMHCVPDALNGGRAFSNPACRGTNNASRPARTHAPPERWFA